MIVGAVTLTSEDLERLAAVVAPLIAAQLQQNGEQWFTPKAYVEAGYATSEGAVRQRVRRGSIKSQKVGGRLLVAGPSNEA
jgi:hypothetical protein